MAHALDNDFRLVPPLVMPRCNDAQKTGSDRRCRHCLVDACRKTKLSTCLGGLGLWVAQLGFAAQATYWSAVELHMAIMPNMCCALHRQHSERHLEETLALAAKTALPTAGVAVDDHAVVQLECDARKVLESSPCAGDKEAAEVIRPAPVQATHHVPPRSVARDMLHAKLQSRILSATEAVQAAKLHGEIPSEQQAIMLSACGQGTGTTWTAMHKYPTEILQNAQWRMATALRLGLTPGPRHVRLVQRQRRGHVRTFAGEAPVPLILLDAPGRRAIKRSCVHCMLLSEAGRYADIALSCTTGLSRNPMLTLC